MPKVQKKSGKSSAVRRSPRLSAAETSEEEASQRLGSSQGSDGTSSDESEIQGAPPTKIAKKIYTDLIPEQEQKMVDWLNENPVLYDKLSSYKDTRQ